jgi:ABC-type antimicrobial peptide transport system permease subunit
MRNNGIMQDAPSVVYMPLAQRNREGQMQLPRNVDYLIRTRRAGSAVFIEELKQALARVNASVPLAKVRTLEEVYRKSMARTALVLALMGIAGGMALVLGVVGIYGVVAYAVARRRKDIGIRMALGASGASVAGLFLRDGLRTALMGAVIGLLAALGLTRLMASMLFGVGPLDPLTYGAVAMVLLGAAALASWWSARRAAAVNPIEALRVDA